MPTRKCLGTNKTTFQSILGVSINVRKYCQTEAEIVRQRVSIADQKVFARERENAYD